MNPTAGVFIDKSDIEAHSQLPRRWELPWLALYPFAWMARFAGSSIFWFLPAGLRLGTLWLLPRRSWWKMAIVEWAAILALSLSTGCVNGAEGPFFMTATAAGGENPGAAAGMLNLMGNLGGVLSIWLVPRMSAAWGWNGTLVLWSAVCLVAALLWLTVDVDAAGEPKARG